MYSNEQQGINDALSNDTFNAFHPSTSHSQQDILSADQSQIFSPGMANSFSGGTPDRLEEVVTSNDEVSSYYGRDTNRSTEPADGEEFLVLPPLTPEHELLIYHLLQPSKECYFNLTYQEPPETDSNQSYLWQYADLQGSLTRWWRSHGQGTERPNLIGLVSCTSEQLTWNVPTPPQLSVDLTSLLTSVFSQEKVPEEAGATADSQDSDNTANEDIFNSYVHLDGPVSPVSSPSNKGVVHF